MRFAYGIGGKRIEPSPGIYGICGFCYGEMIPKCGQYVRWHWAHKSTIGCDPWHESETDWHRIWKDCFPIENQEVVHVDPLTGETHIADVKTDCGRVSGDSAFSYIGSRTFESRGLLRRHVLDCRCTPSSRTFRFGNIA